eukprot:TRINITY_DN21751_c0_g1_i1.p1 TRINITY_DN21751_c0_g1~~TRINITY_DN21751_c0_g1_i1.p1  ORF type:complete len:460 (-),score=55.84 TRINITY_DN21751_c0_g1_i1:42-1421(-)
MVAAQCVTALLFSSLLHACSGASHRLPDDVTTHRHSAGSHEKQLASAIIRKEDGKDRTAARRPQKSVVVADSEGADANIESVSQLEADASQVQTIPSPYEMLQPTAKTFASRALIVLLPLIVLGLMYEFYRQDMLKSVSMDHIALGCSALSVIVSSTALINFNKQLLREDIFPYPVALVTVHSVFIPTASLILLLVRPSFFPSLTDADRKVTIDIDLILKGAIPIAVFGAGGLLFSNIAYQYSSVPFLQMLKEGAVVVVYGFSVAFGMELFRFSHIMVLLLLSGATMLTVEGELHCSRLGVLIQSSAILVDGAKIVLQNKLLNGSGKKLDPLTYLLLVMPFCFLCFVPVLAGASYAGWTSLSWPGWHVIMNNWRLLLANSALAFALNLLVAIFNTVGSAVSFTLVGIIKDVMIVLVGAAFAEDPPSPLQSVAFTAQISLVATWAYLKTCSQSSSAATKK